MDAYQGVDKSLFEKNLICLELKVQLAMLGSGIGEFYINKNDVNTILVKCDVRKNMKEAYGIDEDPNQKIEAQFVYVVFHREEKKYAAFCVNSKGEKFVDDNYLEMLRCTLLWVPEIQNFINSLKNAYQVDLNEGDIPDTTKYEHVKDQELKYWYYLKNNLVVVLDQNRPDDYGLLSNLTAFIIGGREATSEDFVQVPEGVIWRVMI